MAYCASCPNKSACAAAGKCAKTGKKLTMSKGGMAKKKPVVKKAYGGLTTKAGKASGGMAKKKK